MYIFYNERYICKTQKFAKKKNNSTDIGLNGKSIELT